MTTNGLTVRELIEQLSACDPESFVSVAREEYWVIGIEKRWEKGVDLECLAHYPDNVSAALNEKVEQP